jgi:hypothetical protein
LEFALIKPQQLKGLSCFFVCNMKTQQHPGSKAKGNTRHEAARVAAGTIITGGI